MGGAGQSTFEQGIIIALLVMTGLSIALFTRDRWVVRPSGEPSRGARALFANPFLKVAAILLLVLIVVGDYTGNIAWLVVATVAATVAGADFVLLFTAIIRGNKTFVKEFFKTERVRLQQKAQMTAKFLGDATEARTSDGVMDTIAGRPPPEQDEVEDLMRRVASRPNILWVDDNPKANHLEVSAFREMGFGVDIRMTNEAARKAYLQKRYDLIISDIDRTLTESETAGLNLPSVLEDADPDRAVPPFVYYVHKVDAAITDLGHPVVNTPSALLEAVAQALGMVESARW